MSSTGQHNVHRMYRKIYVEIKHDTNRTGPGPAPAPEPDPDPERRHKTATPTQTQSQSLSLSLSMHKEHKLRLGLLIMMELWPTAMPNPRKLMMAPMWLTTQIISAIRSFRNKGTQLKRTENVATILTVVESKMCHLGGIWFMILSSKSALQI